MERTAQRELKTTRVRGLSGVVKPSNTVVRLVKADNQHHQGEDEHKSREMSDHRLREIPAACSVRAGGSSRLNVSKCKLAGTILPGWSKETHLVDVIP